MKLVSPIGATPINDCSGLIPKWVHTMQDLNRVEAESILSAQVRYLREQPARPSVWFKVEFLKGVHQTMFKEVWKWAGIFRQSVTTIGIKPYLIASSCHEFCQDVQAWFNECLDLSPLEMTARVHHRLVFIHP